MNFFSLFKRKILYKIKKKINIDSDGINLDLLDDLFHHYGSDKAQIFKKKNIKGHGFSKYYTQYLKHLKNKEINILEIGSFAGSSAAAFAKYFTNSNIYCFDVNISNFIYSSNKINVYGLDVNNKNKLENEIKKIYHKKNFNFFDIIIDDGSHYLSDILFGLKNIFKYLNKKGIYIIEDFKHPNYYNYNKDVDDILIDEALKCFKEKKLFNSNILKKEDQLYFHKNINKIITHKGNLNDSDICFIERY